MSHGQTQDTAGENEVLRSERMVHQRNLLQAQAMAISDLVKEPQKKKEESAESS